MWARTTAMIATLFLGLFVAALLSLWVRRDPKVWKPLLITSILAAVLAGQVLWLGLAIIAGLWGLWGLYEKTPVVGVLILLVSLGLKLRLLPGFCPFPLTPTFAVGLEGPLIGFFPLALLVPLARTAHDWRGVLKGIGLGCAGIGVLALLALASRTVQWHFKLPALSYLLSNLFLTSISEEGFFRGWIQATLTKRWGGAVALLLTSLLFTAAHIYWSPNGAILAFVFLASLLYGGVFLLSGKIESAIFTHFLLNTAHMSLFFHNP